MDGILKPLKTLEDWTEAMDVARFDCDHSRAQIVPSKSKTRTSRKIAFLSAFPLVKSQRANCNEVKRTGDQTKKHELRSGTSTDPKIQIFVRSSVKETISLRLLASTSISTLKGILQEKSGIPLEKQYIYTMKGLLLCDALSLEDHGIDCGTNLELQLVPGLMGGGKKRKSAGARNKSEPTPPRQEEPITAESVRGQSVSTPQEEEDTTRGASTESVRGQSVSTPQEEEQTTKGASTESVRGQSESTPVEEEHTTRGASIESVRGQSVSTPQEEEHTTRGTSAESVSGHSVSTPQEEEHTTRGASSAESAPQSNPSATASEHQQRPIFNLHINKGHCTIGHSSGNTYNYGIPITTDVQRNNETDPALTDRLLHTLQPLFKDYQVMIGLSNLFRSASARLANIVPGSVKFIANVTCREGLDKLWAMYQSGELSKRLTEILITDELTTENKSNITLKVTMMESDYRQGCECSESIEEKLPERMADWTVGHVEYWLLDIGVKKHFVEQLFQEGFDGKALLSYTRNQLIEDFNVDKIGSRLISNGKENWLKSVNRHPEKPTERKVTKVDRDESGQMDPGLPFQTTDVTTRATDGSSKDETDTQRDESTQQTHSMHSESTQVCNPPSTANPQTPKPTDKHSEHTSPHRRRESSRQVDAGKTFPTTESLGHCKSTSLDEAEKKSQPSVRPKQRVAPLQSKKQQLISTDRESTTSMNITLQHPSTSQDELALEEGQSAQIYSSIPVQSECETTEISTEVLMRRKQTASASTSDKETDFKKHIGPIHDESKAKLSSQTAAAIAPNKSKPPAGEEMASVVPRSKQKIPPHRALRQRSGESYAEEPRLRKLLTGDERGELDESFYPVLIVNKPPDSAMPSEADLEQGSIAEQFGFIKAIKWVTVLDFYSKSLVNGLCKLYHDERMVTLQQPALFKDIGSDVELRNSIDFPEKTLWIFTNGREDDPSFETPRMNLQDWNKQRSRDVEASISFFSKPSVIPEGRAVILFLILSDDEIDILCDTFRKISSSFQGLQNITCIAEDQETYAQFVSGVGKWFSEDEINQISVVGLNWQEINRIMMRMEGIHQTMDHELPCLGGRPCFLSDKQREEWNDITVIYKNECENTDMDESNPGYESFAQQKELSFYHGEKVDWWNFALGDKVIGKGCGHVLKRKGFGELLQKMSKPLNSRKFNDSKIVTVTLLHEPGAGGSTLARHVFWELHREHRCIVINRVTNNTINQIMEVLRYGYRNQDAEKIPPVCVLVENLDDMELVDLIAELEEVSKCMDTGHGAVCVLLHCKRSAMSFKITQDKSDLEVALYHKMDESEKERFQRKYTELEDKEKVLQTGEFKPDNLLAFMVMKEEFNPEYIKDVVSRILLDVKNDELLLIKYCAFLNSYRPDSVIPTSCCDSMMGSKSPLMRLGGISHHISSPKRPWEKLVSPSFNIMVLRQDNGIKIFHKNIAEEALRQIMQKNGNESLFDITAEFLNSELLKSKSYSRQNLVRTTHDLLIRRTKLPNEAKTDFSDLIGAAIKSEGSQAAIKILKLGFEILDDAFVAQQVARLYLRESEFDKARTYADKALKLDSKNVYFWDTKGRILKKKLENFSKPFLDEKQVMEDDVCRNFTSWSFEAMGIFRKSYEVSKEKMQTEYTGLYAEVDVAFGLLKVIYTCVEPLRTHGFSKTQHSKHALSPQLESTFLKLKTEIDFVLDLMDDITTYYKDGSHAQVARKTLDETKEFLRKYTSPYSKYFGETLPGNYGYPIPTNALEERRLKVKQLKCDRFRDIFDLARAKNEKVLQQSLQLLEQNSSDYRFFDLKTQILIHLALSSIDKPVMKADDVYQKLVRPLFKELDRGGSFYPPFFMMMFLWPIEGVVSERKDRNDLSYYSSELIKRGDNDGQERVKRHAKYNMKPRTYFFLGQGTDLRVFAHISELPLAAQNKLDKHDRDGTFWYSDFVKTRLLRLKGILVSSMYLVYRSPKGEDINIKLAVPYKKRTPSQEKVEFYLGFSWVGPVAYDVTAKNKTHEDTFLRFHEAYPKHILQDATSKTTRSSDSVSINKLRRKLQDLNLELQTSGKKGYKTDASKHKRDDIKLKLKKTQAELTEALEKLEDPFEDNSL